MDSSQYISKKEIFKIYMIDLIIMDMVSGLQVI